ncbi:MAG: transposase [Terriglobales bacterium]
MQFLKGGFSFRAKRDLGFDADIWQAGFNEHRVKDAQDYVAHAEYIRRNPVKAGYVPNPADYKFCSAHIRFHLDPPPEHLLG